MALFAGAALILSHLPNLAAAPATAINVRAVQVPYLVIGQPTHACRHRYGTATPKLR